MIVRTMYGDCCSVRTSQETAIEALRAQPRSDSRDAELAEAEQVAWRERQGNSWQTRLNATTVEEAESSCVKEELEWEWQPDGGLMVFTSSPGFIDARPGETLGGPAATVLVAPLR